MACLLAVLPAGRGQTLLFGNFSDLGGSSSHSPDYLLGSSIDVTQTVTLEDAGIIFRTTGYEGEVAVYTDNSGLPGQLIASTGPFAVSTTGPTLIPFTSTPLLSPGNYWFMAVFDNGASVGFTSNTTALVAYQSFVFGSALPTTFGSPITYTGQAFNYYFVTVPEPSTVALVALGGAIVVAGMRGRRFAGALTRARVPCGWRRNGS